MSHDSLYGRFKGGYGGIRITGSKERIDYVSIGDDGYEWLVNRYEIGLPGRTGNSKF